MTGFYRGLIHEALTVVEEIGADLWVVQGGRTGPFAEESVVPVMLDRRLEGVRGVSQARRFLQFPLLARIHGKDLRIAINAIDYAKDRGDWIPLVSGRPLSSGHYEVIVDRSTGLALGDRLKLGKDEYRVVGLTKGQVNITADNPLLYISLNDALDVANSTPSEMVLLSRAELNANETGPLYVQASAVVVTLSPGAEMVNVLQQIRRWPDITVVTKEQQEDWIVNGLFGKLRLQILNFIIMLLIIAGTILALTMYADVLEKSHFIALIKILGASDFYVLNIVLLQALVTTLCSFFGAVVLSFLLAPTFPRSVLLEPRDLASFGFCMLLVCLISSIAGIRQALRIRAQDVLG